MRVEIIHDVITKLELSHRVAMNASLLNLQIQPFSVLSHFPEKWYIIKTGLEAMA